MTDSDGENTQNNTEQDMVTEMKSTSALSSEGEIPCVVVYSDEKHVDYIHTILNSVKRLLTAKFKTKSLSEEIKPLDQYGKSFMQLAEECALGIVILDGLRPNVLLELGILIGKNKPIVILQDERASVSVRSFYQDLHESGLTEAQFKKLNEPSLGHFSHISDLQGLHIEIVDKNASLNDPKHTEIVVRIVIEKLMPEILQEHNRINLQPATEIGPDYLEQFHAMSLEISEYYVGGGVHR